MKKSILSLIIFGVIVFSQSFIYKVSGQTNKSKAATGVIKEVENTDQKSLKLRSDKLATEKFAFGTLLYNGHTYKTIIINGKEWMAENLAYLPAISPPTIGSYTEPHYYVYDYVGSDVATAKQQPNYAAYGVLYNWPAAKAACPPGWHLPSDAEWTALEVFLISNGYNFDGTTTDNKIAKSLAATTKWNTDSRAGAIGNNHSLNNKTGFSGLPAGQRVSEAKFSSIGEIGRWWSSTAEGTGYAITRYLYFKSFNVQRTSNYTDWGISVRCVKD